MYIPLVPARSVDENATCRPSGEIWGASPRRNVESCGGMTENTSLCEGGSGRRAVSRPPSTVAATRPSTATGQARRGPHFVDGRPGGTGAVTAPLSASPFSCSSTSVADDHRSPGSLARHTDTSRSSAGGAAGAACVTRGGSKCRIAPISEAWLEPPNARCPVTISCSIAPKAKMSARASTSLPCSCSGAMYGRVPRISPWNVSAVAVGCSATPLATLARPKSSSLAPVFVSITLPGFKSRWTTPARCAKARPSAIWMAQAIASAGAMGPCASRAARVTPSSFSITRNIVPSCWPTSCSVQMLGWEREAIAAASRSKRARRPASSLNSRGSTLMATLRSSLVSLAA